MNQKLGPMILIFFIAACSTLNPTPTQPPVSEPSSVPPILASPTRLSTDSASATQVSSAPTHGATAPSLRERVTLRDLPGIGRNPYGMVILDGKVYVSNATTNNVAVIQNDRVVKFIPVGKQPSDIALDPGQKRIYVANSADKTITLIANDQVTLTTSIGEDPNTLLFFENRLFVGLGSRGNILVLDPTTLQTQSTIGIPKAYSIIHLAGDTVHHRIYAGIYDYITVIDSTNLRLLTTFDAKGSYYALSANPSNDSVLATIYESGSGAQYLVALDPVSGAVRGRVKVGGDPRGSVVTSDSSRMYIANSYPDTVSVINTRDLTQIAEIPVGNRPFGVALDEAAHRLYISNASGDNVNVVDLQTNQVMATIPLAMNFSALATNEAMNRVYIANASTDSVFVLEGSRVVKEIPVGRNPVDLSRDAQNNRLFVANSTDNTLSIIDEVTFAIRSTQPITRFLTTVAVDNSRSRIFAGDQILDANTLAPIGQLRLRGFTIGSNLGPDWIRLNPNINRVYAFGSNGVPGSNGRLVTYSLDATTLQQRGILGFSGNTSYLTIDPETNRVFIAGTHPLAGTSELGGYDQNDTRVVTMTLPARPSGIVYNPPTHHLFVSLAPGYSVSPNPATNLNENTVLIFDTNSWGKVAQLNVPAPGKMTRIGNIIYVTNRDDGTVSLIEDANVPTPPSPTPTTTPTPYPTLPPLPTATRTAVPVVRNTTLPLCKFPIASLASQRWNADLAARIGCPTEAEHTVGFATQSFDGGSMFWREDEKHIIVLFNDKSWSQFDDLWNTTLPEDACPGINVAPGKTKPKRGFGKVWCELSGVRAKIGAATGPEVGYAPLTQGFERGQMFAGTQTNQVFVLFTNGTWQ